MTTKDPIGLTDFKIPLSRLAPSLAFRNREDQELSFRYYSAWSDRLLIFYHGIGGDSRYICALASFLAQNNLASVLTPDFRGHGKSRSAVAQVTSPESLLNDLQDLLHHIDAHYPDKELSIGGHSLGGGFALKAMNHEVLRKYFKSAVVMSPYLHALFAGESGERFSSWVRSNPEKGLYELQMPEGYKTGNEVLTYEVKFFEAASLTDITEIEQLKTSEHLVTIASTGDQLSPAARYKKIFSDPHFHLHILEGYSHMGQVMSPQAHQDIAGILKTEFLWA
jgi:non-heme chloroperoxidase